VKDYAKRSVRPVRHTTSDSNWQNTALLLLAIFFAVFACIHFIQKHVAPKLKLASANTQSAVVVTPEKKPVVTHMKTVEQKPEKKAKKTAAAPAAPVVADNQPKFDFYKLLPQMTVNISTDDDSTTSPIINNKPITKKSAPIYVLQVAALQKDSDATQVQNTLKAAGYAAFTQSYQAPDHTAWYRVLVGPFNNLKTAQAEQDKLDAHQTEALLTTMK
jgi:cell division protein FtsN